MKPLSLSDVSQYVEQTIGNFHKKKLVGIQKLSLTTILKRKNPYLFKAKNILTADEFIRSIVDAHISSNEEGLFGNWLEELAIFVNSTVYGGRKAGIKGIDLEFDNDGIRYIVNIKSGGNWGNDSQVKRMRDEFNTAKKTIRTTNSKVNVVAVNGCCYGTDDTPDKGDYFKYCGQQFWEFISGSPNLYTELIIPLGHEAQERNDEFKTAHAELINKFTNEFYTEYCTTLGKENSIDWDKLLKFNSGKKEINEKRKRTSKTKRVK